MEKTNRKTSLRLFFDFSKKFWYNSKELKLLRKDKKSNVKSVNGRNDST